MGSQIEDTFLWPNSADNQVNNGLVGSWCRTNVQSFVFRFLLSKHQGCLSVGIRPSK